MLKKVLSVILAALLGVAIGGGICGILYMNKLWVFAEDEIPPVGFPVEITLHGGAELTEPALQYAVCPSIIRDKSYYTPEAIAWPAGYFYYWDKNPDMDISDEVTEGEVPLFLQWDSRWGYRLYGTNYMGNNGCGPTALAIVYAGLTGNADQSPYDIAVYAIGEGLYWAQQGTHRDLMTRGAEYLGLTVTSLEKDEEAIRQGLRDGQLMIAHVTEGDFTRGGHFIVFVGITDEGQLIIRDPNSRINTDKLWDFAQVMEQTTTVWGYTYEAAEAE